MEIKDFICNSEIIDLFREKLTQSSMEMLIKKMLLTIKLFGRF